MPRVSSWSLLLGSRRLAGGGGRFSPRDERRLQEITTRHFPSGYTILAARGGWFDPEKKKFLREDSRQVLVTGSAAQMKRWARELGQTFRQKEILVLPLAQPHSIRIR